MSPVDLFSALADPTRCRVVELLAGKSRPVHELAAAFDISRPAISRHLRVLKEAGLVREEKRGRENVYALQRGRMKPMMDWLDRQRVKPVPAAGSARKPVAARARVAAKPVAPVAELAAKPARAPKPAAAPALPQLSLDF